eukprot:COSAG01_NODE_386_length_17742_cov_25.176654_8_plen_196_part_00
MPTARTKKPKPKRLTRASAAASNPKRPRLASASAASASISTVRAPDDDGGDEEEEAEMFQGNSDDMLLGNSDGKGSSGGDEEETEVFEDDSDGELSEDYSSDESHHETDFDREEEDVDSNPLATVRRMLKVKPTPGIKKIAQELRRLHSDKMEGEATTKVVCRLQLWLAVEAGDLVAAKAAHARGDVPGAVQEGR